MIFNNWRYIFVQKIKVKIVSKETSTFVSFLLSMLNWKILVAFISLMSVCFGGVKIENGIYDGITVGLHPNILEKECDQIVQSVQVGDKIFK